MATMLTSFFWWVRWPCVSSTVFLCPLFARYVFSLIALCAITYKSKWHDSWLPFHDAANCQSLNSQRVNSIQNTDSLFLFLLVFHDSRFYTIFYALYFLLSYPNYSSLFLEMFKTQEYHAYGTILDFETVRQGSNVHCIQFSTKEFYWRLKREALYV